MDYPCGPKCNHMSIRDKQREIAHGRGGGNLAAEAGTREIQLQAQECWQPHPERLDDAFSLRNSVVCVAVLTP